MAKELNFRIVISDSVVLDEDGQGEFASQLASAASQFGVDLKLAGTEVDRLEGEEGANVLYVCFYFEQDPEPQSLASMETQLSEDPHVFSVQASLMS